MNPALANEPWLIYALIFGAGVLGVEALYWVIYRASGTKKSINRRLALSTKLASSTEVLDALRRERGFADFKNPALADLNDLLVQTGLRVSKGVLLLWIVVLGILFFALALPFFGLGPRSFVIALAIPPMLVLLFLRITRARRMARFAEQLPDAIEIVVRGLRVGHPFSTAIDLVARELPDPIGSEFGITSDEMTFGLGLNAAVNNLYRRVGQGDLLFLVIAVTVQSQTGGNLAEILSRLSTLVRQRSKLRLKIRALTAEGRMSARFLSAAPFILFGVISFLSPTYFTGVTDHPLALPLLGYSFLSLFIGNIVMYRMVNFKI
jgi:tight adherence protein B